MAAKEPTVNHEEAMRRLVRFAFSDDDGDPDLSLLPGFKAALEKATRAASERAWDEGAEAALDYVMFRDKSLRNDVPGLNPYRQPKGPTK